VVAPTPDAQATEISPAESPTPEPAGSPAAQPIVGSAAALAIQLIQLSVESSAQATILMRGNPLVASAGKLGSGTIAAMAEMIKKVWQGWEGASAGNSLIRYLQLPDVKDFLLFSIGTVDGMYLSMLFPSETPVRIIRQQAEKLRRALYAVPEPEATPGPTPEPEAASTLHSRPTDPVPPEGLREQLRVRWTETVEASGQVTPPPPQRKEGPYAPYTFVWLPRNTGIEPEIAEMLLHWLTEIAAEHSWEIEGAEIQIPFVSLQISIPAD